MILDPMGSLSRKPPLLKVVGAGHRYIFIYTSERQQVSEKEIPAAGSNLVRVMRKYAYLKEPLKLHEGDCVYKIMICETEEGFYLFEYFSPDAVMCSSDLLYTSLDDLYEDWNSLIDEKGWQEIDDPLPGCQQDAFIPLRVKGRDTGKPEWGRYETLRDGEWTEYKII